VDSRRAKDGGLGHKSGSGVNGLGWAKSRAALPGSCPCPVRRGVPCEATASASATDGPHRDDCGRDVPGRSLQYAVQDRPKFWLVAPTAQHGRQRWTTQNQLRLADADCSATDSFHRALGARCVGAAEHDDTRGPAKLR